MGDLKRIYYGIADFQKGYSDNLKPEVKHYLREKHMDLIISLPDHEEPPPPKDSIPKLAMRIHQEIHTKRINYSKYLDKLLTRQILKTQRLIKI